MTENKTSKMNLDHERKIAELQETSVLPQRRF